jgi:hypothetical protein
LKRITFGDSIPRSLEQRKPAAAAQPCFFYFLKALISKLLALLENKKTD